MIDYPVWPKIITSLQESVWCLVDVEDFSWNIQKFKVVKYSSDIISLEVVEWKYIGVLLQLDLWTNSILEVTIKNIFLDWNIIFSEDLIENTNRENAISLKNTLDISKEIANAKAEYRKKISDLLSLKTWVDVWLDSLVQEIWDIYYRNWIIAQKDIIIP